ncbi:thioredoxin-like protein, partial [Sparassis latifolia]
HLTSLSQLNTILANSRGKLSVINLHATWSVAPSQAINPTFEVPSRQYANVNFITCDVDLAHDIANMYSVRATPTFIFLKGSTKVDQVRGAN